MIQTNAVNTTLKQIPNFLFCLWVIPSCVQGFVTSGDAYVNLGCAGARTGKAM